MLAYLIVSIGIWEIPNCVDPPTQHRVTGWRSFVIWMKFTPTPTVVASSQYTNVQKKQKCKEKIRYTYISICVCVHVNSKGSGFALKAILRRHLRTYIRTDMPATKKSCVIVIEALKLTYKLTLVYLNIFLYIFLSSVFVQSTWYSKRSFSLKSLVLVFYLYFFIFLPSSLFVLFLSYAVLTFFMQTLLPFNL